MNTQLPKDFDKLITDDFIIELAQFYYETGLFPYLRCRDNMEFLKIIPMEYDHLILRFQAILLKGKEYQSVRVIKNQYEFQVFKSWVDHLKFRINNKFKTKFKINYQKIIRYREDKVPVIIDTFCPHYQSKLGDQPYLHLSFLNKIKP